MPRASEGFTDLHSHLVPGVDDGSRTMEEAVSGIRALQEAGIRTIVTTPHLDGSLTRDLELFQARLHEVGESFERMYREVREVLPDVDLRLAYEVMLDVPDPDLSDPRLHLSDASFALVEWPGLRVPPSTDLVLERLVESGVKPILAHPERYRGMDKEALVPGEWRAKGALLQVNYGSVAGRYGETPRRRAITFLERGWVDLMASDFHGRPHLSPFLSEARSAFSGWGEGDQFELLGRVNPARILRGEDPLPVPPIAAKHGLWQRLRDALQPKGRR
jgi:protein-tyrosine phosphatase